MKTDLRHRALEVRRPQRHGDAQRVTDQRRPDAAAHRRRDAAPDEPKRVRLRLVHRVADASKLAFEATPLASRLELDVFAFAQHACRRGCLAPPPARRCAAASARAEVVKAVVVEVASRGEAQRRHAPVRPPSAPPPPLEQQRALGAGTNLLHRERRVEERQRDRRRRLALVRVVGPQRAARVVSPRLGKEVRGSESNCEQDSRKM